MHHAVKLSAVVILVLNDCEYRYIVQLQGNIDRFQVTDKRFRTELLDDIDVSNDLLDQLKKKKVLSERKIKDIKVTLLLFK